MRLTAGAFERAVAELADDVSQMRQMDAACQRACDRLESILGGPVAILERAGSRWRLRSCTTGPGHSGDAVPDTPEPHSSSCPDVALSRDLAAEATKWAWVPLGVAELHVLLVPAHWREPQGGVRLPAVLGQLGLALQMVARRDAAARRERLLNRSYAFARRLSAIIDGALVPQFVLDEIARAAGATLGALAVHSGTGGWLQIVATFGYPHLLVEHIRIRPPEGVIGTVYDSRRPLLVRDVTRHPALQRSRPRYGTRSFMALPLLAGRRAVGVLCFADRADAAPFDGEDLRIARLFAVPAALALRSS